MINAVCVSQVPHHRVRQVLTRSRTIWAFLARLPTSHSPAAAAATLLAGAVLLAEAVDEIVLVEFAEVLVELPVSVAFPLALEEAGLEDVEDELLLELELLDEELDQCVLEDEGVHCGVEEELEGVHCDEEGVHSGVQDELDGVHSGVHELEGVHFEEDGVHSGVQEEDGGVQAGSAGGVHLDEGGGGGGGGAAPSSCHVYDHEKHKDCQSLATKR